MEAGKLIHERVEEESENLIPLQVPLLDDIVNNTSTTRRNRIIERREIRITKSIIKNKIIGPVCKYLRRQFNFLLYNTREIWKRKFGFCLGLFSCVLVVLSVCCTVSVTDHLPVIFLRISENQIGQFDTVLRSSGEFGRTVNYTKFGEVLKRSSVTRESVLHSPRIKFFATTINAETCSRSDIWSDGDFEKTQWFYKETCPTQTTCGVESYCDSGFEAMIIAFDTNREKEMGFGRKWNRKKLNPGECVISAKFAGQLGLRMGDSVLINANNRGSSESVFTGLFEEVGLGFRNVNWTDWDNSIALFLQEFHFVFPLKIVGIEATSFRGKNRVQDSDVIYVEYESFYHHITQYMSTSFNDYRSKMMSVSPYGYAKEIYVNGKDRIEMYNTNDFQVVQNRVTGLLGDVLYMIGFDQFEADYPLLPIFQSLQMIGMFLGLIVDVIIAILIGLSILLIYTLLLINVEERVFEMGVLRMVGMSLKGVFELLIMQAMMLSIPGVIIGLILGQILYFGMAVILQLLLKADVPYTVTFISILASSFVGLVIPVISAILPIKSAMGQQLNEALDTRRSKTKAVKVEISRMSESRISWSMVIVALSSFSFGFFIYYFLPLALITMQFQLLLLVFFAIILMSLLGLVMLALNVERIIQMAILKLVFFWEYVAVKNMISKNLIAHKTRNRKTTLMYGISLAFLIFISVSTGLEMKLYAFQLKRTFGTKLVLQNNIVDSGKWNLKIFSQFDDLIDNNEFVEDYAYQSFPLQNLLNMDQYVMRPIGDYFRVGIYISAISPNFYEVLDKQFLIVDEEDKKYSGWSVSEQLYGVEGSYGIMSDKRRKIDLGVENIHDQNIVFEMKKNTNMFPKYTYQLLRFNTVLESAAGSTFTKYLGFDRPEAFVSFPSMRLLLEGFEEEFDQQSGYPRKPNKKTVKSFHAIDEIPIQKVFFKLKGGISDIEVLTLMEKIKTILGKKNEEEEDEDEYDDSGIGFTLTNVNEEIERIEVIENVMSFFFYLSTAFTMIMCFFSLVSNMYTNVQEQAMEIGILRAMGCRKWTLNRIYVYESLIIIYTAGIIGVIIGTAIGYTMVLQQQLFTQLPLPFVFPYEIVVTVLIVGIICGFLASVFPINLLLFKNIVSIMRKI